MKRRIFVSFLICVILSVCVQTEPVAVHAAKPDVSAEAAIVMDVQSGSILYSKNIDKKEYPASITKIMTALVAIENSSLSEVVTYSDTAVLNLETGASNVDIQVGEKLTMEESLYAILLMSANEVCNGVAEHIAGSVDNFVKMMNRYAKKIGCTGTHFANANGLWMENHYTTAHDMALIARTAYKNPTFAKITGTKRYNIPKTNKHDNINPLYNHHGMLYAYKYPQYLYQYCVGGKTGYTIKCRWTLVTYAKKNGMTLLCVVMRTDGPPPSEPNEYTDTIKLFDYCFANYKRHDIRNDEAGKVTDENLFTKFSSYYNTSSSALSIDEDAGVILPKGVKLNKTQKKVEYYDTPKVTADNKKIIGNISYSYKNKFVGGSDIYYTENQVPSLNDSIDMSEWFDVAVEKANEEPMVWKRIVVIAILVVTLMAAVLAVWLRMRSQRDRRIRRNRYKRTRKSMRDSNRKYYQRRRRY